MGQIQMPASLAGGECREAFTASWPHSTHRTTKAAIHPAFHRRFCTLFDQATSVASSVIVAFSSLETGQPAFALAASSANFA